MEDIEQRALDRAMVRRGEIPVPMAGQRALPTPPVPPPSARFREAAASTSADGMREGIAGLDRAVRGVGQVVGEVLDVRNIGREIGAAVQGVEPVLVEEAITRGALRPLTPQELAATDGPDEREHFSWDGKLYARRFTDPETGETVDVTTPDTAFGRLSRLGRWMGASMAVDADIAGPAAAARALRGERRAAGSVRSGVGPEDASPLSTIERGGEAFVSAPGTGPVFGVVSADLAASAGIRQGEILLPRGWHNALTGNGKGLDHIEQQRGSGLLDKLTDASGRPYRSYAEVARDVLASPDEVLLQAARRSLIFVGGAPPTPPARGRPTKPTVIVAAEWNEAAQGYEIITMIPYEERRLRALVERGDAVKVWPPPRTTANAGAGDPPSLTPATPSEADTPQGTRATSQTQETIAPRAPESNDGP